VHSVRGVGATLDLFDRVDVDFQDRSQVRKVKEISFEHVCFTRRSLVLLFLVASVDCVVGAPTICALHLLVWRVSDERTG
jgi:hypothetical protein